MSKAIRDLGVQPEQGPPLSVPLSFFFLAPLAVMGAGLLSVAQPTIFQWRTLPWTMAMAHLGTLGFLGAVMLGAMYQMLAVVASPVPMIRLAHLVHLLFAIGTGSLVWGFLFHASLFAIAWPALAAAFLLFLLPVAAALINAKTRTTTVFGTIVAVLGLATLVVMGAIMSRTRGGAAFSGDWSLWVYGHLTIGAVVWIGGLLTVIAYQVVPMFYLTAPYPRWLRIANVVAIATTGVSVIAILGQGASASLVMFAAIPGAFFVWVVHPIATLLLLRGRKRKRLDHSVRFWQAGLSCGPVAFGFAVMTSLSDQALWPILLGWTVIWGWAGLIMHGMLSRIVPFIVWFHRYSMLVGNIRVPPMRQLWPKSYLRITLIAHALSYLLGVVAIATGEQLLAQATGISLLVTGALVFLGLCKVTLHMRGKLSNTFESAGTKQP